jgi:hypothetical protein
MRATHRHLAVIAVRRRRCRRGTRMVLQSHLIARWATVAFAQPQPHQPLYLSPNFDPGRRTLCRHRTTTTRRCAATSVLLLLLLRAAHHTHSRAIIPPTSGLRASSSSPRRSATRGIIQICRSDFSSASQLSIDGQLPCDVTSNSSELSQRADAAADHTAKTNSGGGGSSNRCHITPPGCSLPSSFSRFPAVGWHRPDGNARLSVDSCIGGRRSSPFILRTIHATFLFRGRTSSDSVAAVAAAAAAAASASTAVGATCGR